MLLQSQRDGAEGELGPDLHRQPSLVVREPDAGVGALGEQSLGVDHRVEHQALHLAPVGELHPFALHHLDDDRVLLLLEVPVEHVLLAHFERRDPDEIEEGRVVQRVLGAGEGRVLPAFPVEPGVGEDLEAAVLRLVVLHEVLDEPVRLEPVRRHVRLQDVVERVEDRPSLKPEPEPEGLHAPDRIDARHLQAAGAQRQHAELGAVGEGLTDHERIVGR